MESFKILLFVCLIFNFSICANESNEVKNFFAASLPSGILCVHGTGTIKLRGRWNDSQNIPESLSFNLNLSSGQSFPCIFNRIEPNVIKCTITSGKFTLNYENHFMDNNHQYVLKEKKEKMNMNCIGGSIIYNYNY